MNTPNMTQAAKTYGGCPRTSPCGGGIGYRPQGKAVAERKYSSKQQPFLRQHTRQKRQLGPYLFVRANKSSIVNLEKIQSIRTYVNRRLLLTMENGEQLIASRQYAENIKRLLGVGKG